MTPRPGKIATLEGLSFAYDDVGGGPDVLLLVHGHPFDRSMWTPQLAALESSGWRVVAPDLRGYGASGMAGDKTTLDIFAHDLAALLDHLGIASAVIGGLSMGGQIVMEFCRLFPQRVRGLILAATFPQAETPAGRIARNAAADRLLAEGMGPYAEEMLPKMIAANTIRSQPHVADHVRGMMRHARPPGAAAALRGRAERPDYQDVLQGFDGPGLIVVGDEDAFTSRADAERMQTLVRSSRLIWLPGIGHMPNLEASDAFNTALLGFLAELSARSPVRPASAG
ncbi:3-oxoadipate enol-lactonase 2 [bacterium YEK0313]|nr:3-oxoadipate enol-lactonase 2 [bacterium YEK0313]